MRYSEVTFSSPLVSDLLRRLLHLLPRESVISGCTGRLDKCKWVEVSIWSYSYVKIDGDTRMVIDICAAARMDSESVGCVFDFPRMPKSKALLSWLVLPQKTLAGEVDFC